MSISHKNNDKKAGAEELTLIDLKNKFFMIKSLEKEGNQYKKLFLEEKDPIKKEHYREKAAGFFEQALKLDNNNPNILFSYAIRQQNPEFKKIMLIAANNAKNVGQNSTIILS